MRRVRLGRLARMSRHEWGWRTREAVSLTAERLRTRLRPARWKRTDIRRILSGPALTCCATAIERGDWSAAHHALTEQIATRPVRFVLDPSSAQTMRATVLSKWPASLKEATCRADRLIDGRHDFLGYQDIPCGEHGHIDWHADPVHDRRAPRAFYADVPFLDPRIGDHKVIWELNRHQHLLQLGRAAWLSGDAGGRYAHAMVAQLDSWLAANPPYIGVNWASMLEVGFRSMSWTWALHFLLGARHFEFAEADASPWLIDMLVGLDRQLTHVERHLSYYFSPNTHLTGEALALYVVGTALPELAASARWANTGRRVLLDEIDRQVLADGGHAERSTHYQRYTLDFYLLATLTARRAGDLEAAARFEEVSHRLSDFTIAMADADGRLPLIGDDDGGMLWPFTGRACADVRDSLALAAVVLDRPTRAAWGVPEEVVWIAGPDAARFTAVHGKRETSRLFADTGYFTASTVDGSHAVLDVGPHGYQNGGHAHADALSLTLSLEGHPLLIDPGTSTYTMDPQLRDRLRSSASHNTVTLDDRSQSVPDGPFHWRSSVDARVIAHRTNEAFDWIEAVHDGYAPTRHRRTLVRTADAGWLVVNWYFDPTWDVAIQGERELGVGDQESGVGNQESGIGDRVHATHPDGQSAWMLFAGGDVALSRGDDGAGSGWCAPVYGQLAPTWTVRLTADPRGPFPLVTWIGSGRLFQAPRLRCTRADDGDAVIVEIVDGPRTAVFMVRTADTSSARSICRVGNYETDAVMLHYSTHNGRLRTLIAQGTGTPPVVRLDGRDLPLSAKPTTDTLLIHGSDQLPFSGEKSIPAALAQGGAAFARH